MYAASISTKAASRVSVATGGHRVAGVDHQFKMTCSNWPGSARTRASRRGEHETEVDVFADQPGEHPLVPIRMAVDVEQPGLNDLLAG